MDVLFSNWEKAAVIANIVTAILFLAVLGGQIWSTVLTRKAVKAAMESAEAAHRSSQLSAEAMSNQLRPWIGIGSINIDHVESPSGQILATKNAQGLVHIDHGQLPADAKVAYNVPITNYGGFPASRVGIQTDTGYGLSDVETLMRQGTGFRDSVVSPGETLDHVLVISLQDYLHSVVQQIQPLYFACSVAYVDREARAWVVEGVYEIIGTKITKLRETIPEPWPTGHDSSL